MWKITKEAKGKTFEIKVWVEEDKVFIEFENEKDEVSLNYVNKDGEKIPTVRISGSIKKKVDEITGRSIDNITITQQIYDEIKKEIEKNIKEKFLKEGLEIVFEQQVVDNDFPTIAVKKWKVNYKIDSQFTKILPLFYKDVGPLTILSRLYEYAEQNNLWEIRKRTYKGYSEVEVEDKVIVLTKDLLDFVVNNFVTKEEKKELIKEKETLQKLIENEEHLLKHIFVAEVHVTEDGYFSNHEPTCDDCFWFEHIKTPYSEEDFVKKNASSFEVRGYNGKIYTYFSPNPKVLEYLKEKYKEVVEKEKKKIEERLERIDKMLNENLLSL